MERSPPPPPPNFPRVYVGIAPGPTKSAGRQGRSWGGREGKLLHIFKISGDSLSLSLSRSKIPNMSAKWRALQHRHRYTYNAVIFPQPYLDSLNQLPSHELAEKFCVELEELASLNSIYSQVNYVKNVASSFSSLLAAADESLVLWASKLYLELLFLENSLPLHRTLLSALSKNKKFWDLIGGCFRLLCEQYGALCGKGRRFCVSRVALSMMSTPKLGYLVDVVEECCVMMALDIVIGLNSVVMETNGWARPSPLVMEQCQEALSCLYYLLQRFPSKFTDVGMENGLIPTDSSLLEMVVTVILCILKSSAFSRDCFVAAGVSFCAALQVLLRPHELGFLILEAVFEQNVHSFVGNCDREYKNAVAKVPYKGDLCFELRKLSPLCRLCLIRGILTAVSRKVLNFQFDLHKDELSGSCGDENGAQCVQNILYDAILPELCKYCENPTDSHFNFHALTVMQICLQQIKTSILGDVFDLTSNFNPIPEDVGARIIRIVWNNLEDPLNQTVKQVHLIFDLFLDIKSTLCGSNGSVVMSSFLRKLAADLLHLGSRCKGRYIPLASLTRRLGAKTVLDMSPNLLFETVQAYIDDDVCCAVTSFLKCFLERLRYECWNDCGVEKGYEAYRSHCLPAFLSGLASGIPKLRSNLNTYALPSLLEVDVDSIFPMFSFISIGAGAQTGLLYPEISCLDMAFSVEQNVAILVSLLKVSRSLALFEGYIDSSHSVAVPSQKCAEHAFIHIKGIRVEIPNEWLALALTHIDESLRVDAAESLFLNPKTASLPSLLELNLMRISVPLNMRCSSTAFQMKWASLFKKFFARVRTALERQFKQRIWKPYDCRKNDDVLIYNSDDETTASRAEDLYQFMKWLSCFLFFSCYPSAPYERKIMAMELIMIMINVWSIAPPSQGKSGHLSSEDLYPYNGGITNPDSTMLLVSSIIDSWDRLRESSFRILLNFPTPLPGISSEDMVQEVILWAKKLVCSPRVRESDAGALTLRLIFRKYVVELGWMVSASVRPTFDKTASEFQNGECQISQSRFPIIEYMNSLLDWLQSAVEEGEKDLLEACKNSFVHGVLLAMRYTFEELDWNSNVVLSSISEIRLALGKLLDLVTRITSLALWVVSADAWYLPQDMDDEDEDSLLLEIPNQMEMPAKVGQDLKIVQDARPTEQIVMVGCWLAMKEVSLLLGTIIRKIPLPTGASSVDEGAVDDGKGYSAPMSDAVLDVTQLETVGDHFLEVLLKMKHNGAIDKTRAGFTALCNRLLCSDDLSFYGCYHWGLERLCSKRPKKGGGPPIVLLDRVRPSGDGVSFIINSGILESLICGPFAMALLNSGKLVYTLTSLELTRGRTCWMLPPPMCYAMLCQLVESWMEQLMERTVAKGQTVDDLLRRSAGIPAAFSAFFLSEPPGAPKQLLPRALRWLMDVAGGSLLDQMTPSNQVCKLKNSLDAVRDASDACLQVIEVDATSRTSKLRVEGVIPTVHAFNVLKAAFNDTNLATDTSGFSAEAMIISIRSFSSPHWEIRNSACLAYTALVRRMIGFLNVHKRESARRAITSLEFFHRYLSLFCACSNIDLSSGLVPCLLVFLLVSICACHSLPFTPSIQ
ncbi:hypothetical protein Cgig2_005408 [Carnegiea gigantea]|uniref:DUF2428 domain-containing protein n=1 Tax=Carnegiea gigantea TaxID=171969 RepID=A0A9Q1Q5T8_9CARY|nr:hypothetical protein Cgig2_005408 [Carnegiea gigantea]